jgi:hypothetical protein
MRWLLLILSISSCQKKVDDSDFVTAYLERDTTLINSQEHTEAMMETLQKVDTIIIKEEKRIDKSLESLKHELKAREIPTKTKVVYIHDTIVIKEKTNFWGRKRVSSDSFGAIDSIEYNKQ